MELVAGCIKNKLLATIPNNKNGLHRRNIVMVDASADEILFLPRIAVFKVTILGSS
jgi:hypothetical protein